MWKLNKEFKLFLFENREQLLIQLDDVFELIEFNNVIELYEYSLRELGIASRHITKFMLLYLVKFMKSEYSLLAQD